MTSSRLRGVCPIVAVPFDDAAAVDFDSFAALVAHLMNTGVDGLMLFGLASEFYKLTDAERSALQREMLTQTAADPTVTGIISVTDHSSELAVNTAARAEAEGADAVNVLPPFFLGPSEAAVQAHLVAVLEAVTIPVIVQYAPAQTGTRLTPEWLVGLANQHPNLACIKVESQPPGPYVSRLLAASGNELDAMVGYAGVQLPDALRRGASGVQPGCSFSEIYVELLRRHGSGDGFGFADLHTRLLPFISYWMQSVELVIQAEKTILWRRGLIRSERCRQPGYQLDDIERAVIEEFLSVFADCLAGAARCDR